MPNPNRHDQPAEGGVEAVEHTLQKQSETKPADKPATEPDRKPRDNKVDNAQERRP
jgi:hypothetical protein